jgi:uncharacterized membrane protein
MEIFLANFWYMIPNLALACLGFVFAILYLHSKSNFLKIPLFILWFLFLPNTIYLITDLEHYFAQLTKVDFLGLVLLTIQYTVLTALGILTYFAGMMPIEKFFRRRKSKNYSLVFLIFNFAIAFAVVLGKVERTHSWYVFTQPQRVINDITHLLTTPLLITSVIFFGILFNLIYFTFRKRIHSIE